jgi:hypothetical protein
MESTTIVVLDDVFGLWDALVDLANDIGQSQWAVIKWKKRKTIPPEYWAAICAAANSRGKHLTADDLMRVHAAPSPEPSSASNRISA